MPKLSKIETPIKALFLGDSGVGKTGSLWSLAAAGFKIKLYDADMGFGVLNSACKSAGCPEAVDNIEVNSFTNKLKSNALGFAVPIGKPEAWPKFLGALNAWPDSPQEGALTWGQETVMVIDSLTKLGRLALLNAQHNEAKSGKQPEIQHYGTAMAQLEALMGMLYSDHVRCHVIIMTHIAYEKSDIGAMMGLPMSLGEKLAPVIPTYFNTMIVGKSSGKRRILSTKPASMVQTKVEAFGEVKDEYDLADGSTPKPGLYQFFKDHGFEAPKPVRGFSV